MQPREYRPLTREDATATMDGATKGFQRIKLPPAMATTIPDALRRWQRETSITTDASGPAVRGAKGEELQNEVYPSVAAVTQAALLSNMPERVMASWDREGVLRIYACVPNFVLVRQSSVLSPEVTAGAEPALNPHVDQAPHAIEDRVCRDAAARLGCSPDEALQLSCLKLTRRLARSLLGVKRNDLSDARLAELLQHGTLHPVRLWMSPNSAAAPLAFLDSATVDFAQYESDGEAALHGFEPGEFYPDYTKLHAPLSEYPRDQRLGQVQCSYRPDPQHRW